MAGIDISTILNDRYLRPSHVQDLINLYTGTDDNAADIDLTGYKSDYIVERDSKIDLFKTNVDTLIDATSLSEGDKTALKNDIATEITSLKSTLTTSLNNEIPDEIAQNKTDIFTTTLLEINAALAVYDDGTVSFGFTDRRCGGTGRRPGNNEPGDDPDNTTPIHCTSCDGFGKTATDNVPAINWTVTTTF